MYTQYLINKNLPSNYLGAEGYAPQAGLEPATLRLTAGCSTIELLWNVLPLGDDFVGFL